jgi:hypothetical protein
VSQWRLYEGTRTFEVREAHCAYSDGGFVETQEIKGCGWPITTGHGHVVGRTKNKVLLAIWRGGNV